MNVETIDSDPNQMMMFALCCLQIFVTTVLSCLLRVWLQIRLHCIFVFFGFCFAVSLSIFLILQFSLIYIVLCYRKMRSQVICTIYFNLKLMNTPNQTNNTLQYVMTVIKPILLTDIFFGILLWFFTLSMIECNESNIV